MTTRLAYQSLNIHSWNVFIHNQGDIFQDRHHASASMIGNSLSRLVSGIDQFRIVGRQQDRGFFHTARPASHGGLALAQKVFRVDLDPLAMGRGEGGDAGRKQAVTLAIGLLQAPGAKVRELTQRTTT